MTKGYNTGFHHSKDIEILNGDERTDNVNVSFIHILLLADDVYLRYGYDMGIYGLTNHWFFVEAVPGVY
jgi:hypothetical protein